jgi:hypothetical protein
MFAGVFMIALIALTIHYGALIVWGISLVRTSDSESRGPLILFLLNVVPMILIFYHASEDPNAIFSARRKSNAEDKTGS